MPFARYVLENAGHLTFPFRRYQIQKVWRGERPQDGRFREFVQADVDVVGAGELPYHYEVELPLVIADAFAALADVGVPPVRILVNNRRVVEGFARGLGLDDVEAVLRSIDKLDKVGPAAVAELLAAEAGASAEQAAAMLELADVRGTDSAVVERVADLARRHGVDDPLLSTGLAELGALLDAAAARAPGVITADLKIARVAWTTTPGRSTRPSWWGTRTWAPSARAAATTPLPPTARRRTPASACPSASPGSSPACSVPASCGPPGRCRAPSSSR